MEEKKVINSVLSEKGVDFYQLLEQERKRVVQWRILNEATAILNSQLDSKSLPLKFLKCAIKLVSAEEALLALKEDPPPGLITYKYYAPREGSQERVLEERVDKPQGAIEIIFQEGVLINRDSSVFNSYELYGFSSIKKNLLGVPLKVGGKLIGALLMANKKDDEVFTQDDQELLMILGSQLGIALENSRLYESIDEKLQKKVIELEQVNRVLWEKQSILEKTLEIHKQLTEVALKGEGIKAICDSLTTIIGSPVQVEDHNFNVIATSMDKLNSSPFLSGKELMSRDIYAEQVKILFQEKKPVEFVLGANTTQYLVPIVSGQHVLGLITTVLINKTLQRIDKVAMEQGATIIALEAVKQKAVVEQTRRLKENFLEQVLNGDFESEEWVNHRAVQLGFSSKDNYQVIIVEIEQGEKDKSRTELYLEIREFCEDLSPSNMVAVRNNRILIVVTLNSSDDDYKIKTLCRKLGRQLQQLVSTGSWWVALGTRCSKLVDCALSYDKGVTTLDVMKALKLKNKIVANDNLGIFSLIEINPQRFAEFLEKTLGPLLDYDQKHRTELVHTLKLYYKYNGNVLKAARNGYLNPSTIKYRLRRIQEITQLDLKDPEVNLQLQLAIRLINYDALSWE